MARRKKKEDFFDRWWWIFPVAMYVLFSFRAIFTIFETSGLVKALGASVFFLGLMAIAVWIVRKSKRFRQQQDTNRRQRRYRVGLSEASVDQLLKDYGSNPYEFEQYMACVFYDLGYQKVEVTPPVNDRGKDIVMYRDDLKYVVEIKLYAPHNHIGREKIQKLHSAMIDSDADRAIFVTTSDYTENALEYAQKFAIETINGNKLEDILSQLYDQRKQRADERRARRKKYLQNVVDACKKTITLLGNKVKKAWWGD